MKQYLLLFITLFVVGATAVVFSDTTNPAPVCGSFADPTSASFITFNGIVTFEPYESTPEINITSTLVAAYSASDISGPLYYFTNTSSSFNVTNLRVSFAVDCPGDGSVCQFPTNSSSNVNVTGAYLTVTVTPGPLPGTQSIIDYTFTFPVSGVRSTYRYIQIVDPRPPTGTFPTCSYINSRFTDPAAYEFSNTNREQRFSGQALAVCGPACSTSPSPSISPSTPSSVSPSISQSSTPSISQSSTPSISQSSTPSISQSATPSISQSSTPSISQSSTPSSSPSGFTSPSSTPSISQSSTPSISQSSTPSISQSPSSTRSEVPSLTTIISRPPSVSSSPSYIPPSPSATPYLPPCKPSATPEPTCTPTETCCCDERRREQADILADLEDLETTANRVNSRIRSLGDVQTSLEDLSTISNQVRRIQTLLDSLP